MGVADRFRLDPEPVLAELVLDEGRFAGVRATVRLDVPLAEILLLDGLVAAKPADLADEDRILAEFADRFGALISDWNLDDADGQPIAPGDVRALDPALTAELYHLWRLAIADRARPDSD